VLVTGLPLHNVDQAAERLILVEAVVFGAALVVAARAGAFWVRWSLRPLSRVASTAAAVTALALDTGEVALPDRVPDTDPRTEVGQVGAAFNRMLGHVESALGKRQAGEERLRRFAADASHELRTPGGLDRGHAELALRHPEPVPAGVNPGAETGSPPSRSGWAAWSMTCCCSPARHGAPAGPRPGGPDPAGTGRGHRRAGGRTPAPLGTGPAAEPVTMTGDAHRLHQIVANLLANARVHTPPGTRVCVRLRQTPEATTLAVVDNGPGIPEALRDTVFDRFTRAPHSPLRPRPGPVIVAAVAAAHGGTAARPPAPTNHLRVTLPVPSA